MYKNQTQNFNQLWDFNHHKIQEPYCFNFTKHFTRRNFITLFLQPPCDITLHVVKESLSTKQ